MESAAKAGAAGQEPLAIAPPQIAAAWAYPMAEVALGRGDLAAARRWADGAASMTAGWNLAVALMTRARVALAEDNPGSAQRDLHEALQCAAQVEAYLVVPDLLESLARVAGGDGNHRDAARFRGAADAGRGRTGAVRFKIYDADHEATATALRDALGNNDFDATWAEGANMSDTEATAYAQRGRGERKRPSTGWASLTPTELEVVRLAGEGLGNKDITDRTGTEVVHADITTW